MTSTLKPRPHDGAAHDRIESVQILRGLAAFSVMMAHLTYGNGNFYAHLPEVGNLFHYGSLGVYSFFVISGFVIPHAMMCANYSFPGSAKTFFLRRIIRLEPPYLVSVMVAAIIAYAASHTPGYRGRPFGVDATTLALQVAYLVPWFDREWINPVAWTLAIEFQYYIAMIVVAPYLINRALVRQNAFLVVTFLLSMISSNGALIFIYLPFFALGFVTFLRYHRHFGDGYFLFWLAAFGSLCIWNRDVAATIFGLATVALIFVPVSGSVPILTFLGTISYSLYLVHAPIGDRVINLTARLPSVFWIQFAGLAGAVTVSLAAAWVLWRCVEQPSTDMAKQVGRKPARVAP